MHVSLSLWIKSLIPEYHFSKSVSIIMPLQKVTPLIVSGEKHEFSPGGKTWISAPCTDEPFNYITIKVSFNFNEPLKQAYPVIFLKFFDKDNQLIEITDTNLDRENHHEFCLSLPDGFAGGRFETEIRIVPPASVISVKVKQPAGMNSDSGFFSNLEVTGRRLDERLLFLANLQTADFTSLVSNLLREKKGASTKVLSVFTPSDITWHVFNAGIKPTNMDNMECLHLECGHSRNNSYMFNNLDKLDDYLANSTGNDSYDLICVITRMLKPHNVIDVIQRLEQHVSDKGFLLFTIPAYTTEKDSIDLNSINPKYQGKRTRGGWYELVRLLSSKLAYTISKIQGRIWMADTYQQNLELLQKSTYFDEAWYESKNPDVAGSGMQAADHYLIHGGVERRNPSPVFESGYYLETYPDVAASGMNPLIHYIKYGQFEDRDVYPVIKSNKDRNTVKSRYARGFFDLQDLEHLMALSGFYPVGLYRIQGISDLQWVIAVRSISWSINENSELSGIPGLLPALERKAWAEAAMAMKPYFDADDKHELFRQLCYCVEGFSNAVHEVRRPADPESALTCALAAWVIKPDDPKISLEAIVRARLAGKFDVAHELIALTRERFPDRLDIQFQEILLELANGNENTAINKFWEYFKPFTKFSVSNRRTITTVLRSFIRQVLSQGIDTDHPHPLQVPEIFLRYTQDVQGHTSIWHDTPFARLLLEESIDRGHQRQQARRTHNLTKRKGDKQRIRILLLTSGNWKFLVNLIRHMEQHESGIDLRTYDFSVHEETISREHLHEVYAPVSMGLDPASVWEREEKSSAPLAELIDWCDIVFCEWSSLHAVWLSRFLPANKRLVVRLHSFEAFSQWPFFMNYGGVDGIIFVAEHIREFTNQQFKLTKQPVQTRVLPNFNELAGYAKPKSAIAPRTLALVGFANSNKDPLLAAQILALLRQNDSEWRLMFVGDNWKPDTLRDSELEYYQKLVDFIEQNDLNNAIIYTGYRRDIPVLMQDIGFILSCSWREGTHESILEGMACGTIPVIRRWPMVSQFGAPATIYPALDYYKTAEEAARMIEEISDSGQFTKHSSQAIKYALERFDIETVFPDFLDFISDIPE
ncbi:MAG: glycosyltransferase involved in cell wall biosynthesis [Pseudohongiellaceae bacterium]|jgi:glycosyltransferase involved in cell wall biosynthesis